MYKNYFLLCKQFTLFTKQWLKFVEIKEGFKILIKQK